MPLLVPGLDEAATKTLAKRLQKSLKQHSGTPSLAQLQTMLVQAAGHPDWYSAQRFWQARPHAWTPEAQEPDFPEGLRLDIEKSHFKTVMSGLTQAMEDAYSSAPGSLRAVSDHLDFLRGIGEMICNHTAICMVDRLRDLIRKAENPAIFPEPMAALDRMKPLVTRLYCLLFQHFYPNVPMKHPPSPSLLLKERAPLVGRWELLEAAMEAALVPKHVDYRTNQEQERAVLLLCDWWNSNAPESMRHAGCFLVYELSKEDQSLHTLADAECPQVFVDDFVNAGNYALFERPGANPIAVEFLRGQEHNRYINGSTHTYLADGRMGMDMHGTPTEVNESYTSMMGLRELAESIQQSMP